MNTSLSFPARRTQTVALLAVSTGVLAASWVFSLAVASASHPDVGRSLTGRLDVAVSDIWLPHAALAIQLGALALAVWRLRVWNSSGGSPLHATRWALQSLLAGALGAVATGLLFQAPHHSTDTAFAASADAMAAGLVAAVVGVAVSAVSAAILFVVGVYRPA